jgi:stalled ribosome rescue protein Dom34
MTKRVGIWIDHREAVIVSLDGDTEKTAHIVSDQTKHVKYSGSSHAKTPEGSKEVTAEDQRDRKFGNDLNHYYDAVIGAVRDAETILIFGPGEAKGELEKRLEHAGLKHHIIPLETTDKMTDRQIAAKVREHFPA